MKSHTLSAMTLKKFFLFVLLVVIVLLGSRARVAAQDKVVTPVPAIGTEPADDAPLAFPPIEHYAKLWENSMFTTKSLPPPDDAPKGPIFTDNLTLVGIYEVDGALAGVILDRTTSLVTEVRIGAENENGVKIARVTPGTTPDKTRLQLQKGDEAGWVSFAVESAAPPDQSAQGMPGPGGMPAGVQNGSAIPGRPVTPQSNMQMQQNQQIPGPRGIPGGGPAMRNQIVAPPPQPIQQSPVIPVTPVTPAPASSGGDGDIPLPPQ